jgi:hypothetical protein
MNFSQYFFGAGTPVVAMAQCQNDASPINRPNERFVSWLRILACRVNLALWHTAVFRWRKIYSYLIGANLPKSCFAP